VELYIIQSETISIHADYLLVFVDENSDTSGMNGQVSRKLVDISGRFRIEDESQHIYAFDRLYVLYVFSFTHTAYFDNFSVNHRAVRFE